MDCFTKIIEDRIQRAQQEGAFENLPGNGKPLDFDVYKAIDVAAAGILAADSIAQEGKKLVVPDFRPDAKRAKGERPKL